MSAEGALRGVEDAPTGRAIHVLGREWGETEGVRRL